MKRFFLALFLIFVLWLAIDRSGAAIMWWLQQHSQDTTSSKIKHIVENISADVVLMGTSRCNGHYVPSILSDSLDMSVYNAGIDGSDNIFAQYMVLSYILQYHTPKVVCMEVQNSFLDEEEAAFLTTGYFAPYFGLCAEADSVFRLAGTYPFYNLSHLFRYNTKVLAMITGQFKSHLDNEEHGYIPNPQPDTPPELTRWNTGPFHLSNEKLEYMEKFIQRCKERDIMLCFMISPAFSIVDSTYYAQLKAFSARYQIPLLDYHTSGYYLNHPDYFKDSYHLCDKGAQHYTSMFARSLKQLLIALQGRLTPEAISYLSLGSSDWAERGI